MWLIKTPAESSVHGSTTAGTTAGASTSPEQLARHHRGKLGPGSSSSRPYHIYVKMAYHLSREARAGLTEFRIPERLRRRYPPRVSDRGGQNRRSSCEHARRSADRRRGRPRQDADGCRAGEGASRMTTALETLDHLSRRIWRAHVGRLQAIEYRLRARVTVASAKCIGRIAQDMRRFRRRADRREPQSAQPWRRSAIPRDPRIHQRKNDMQMHSALRDALQQDLQGPVQPASSFREPG